MVDFVGQTDNPEDQARLWVIRMDGGKLSAEDDARLRDWLRHSEDNRQAFRDARAFWGTLDDWTEESSASTGDVNFDRLPEELSGLILAEASADSAQGKEYLGEDLAELEEFEVPEGVEFLDDVQFLDDEKRQEDQLADSKLNEDIEGGSPRIHSLAKPSTRFSLFGFEARRISAAAVLLLMLTFGLYQLTPLPEGHYSTGKGEQFTQQLADGSTLTLNTNSYVAVEFSEGERKILLRSGEVYFDVAHDKTRPFVVYAGGGKVRAVGTAFNVFKTDGSVAVTVTEGTVEVSKQAPKADKTQQPGTALKRVTVNQSLVYKEKLGVVTNREAGDIDKRLSWRRQKLFFENTTLEAFVEQLNRYSDNHIMIIDPSLKDIRVGGVFKAGDTDAALAALQASFRVEAVSFTPYLTLLYKKDSQPQ